MAFKDADTFSEKAKHPFPSKWLCLLVSPRSLKALLCFENGWLGPGGDRSGAVRAVKPGASVSDASQGKGSRVWEHANQWGLHFGSRHHLLWPHHYLPHCHWRSHLHWLTPGSGSVSPIYVYLCLLISLFSFTIISLFDLYVSYVGLGHGCPEKNNRFR